MKSTPRGTTLWITTSVGFDNGQMLLKEVCVLICKHEASTLLLRIYTWLCILILFYLAKKGFSAYYSSEDSEPIYSVLTCYFFSQAFPSVLVALAEFKSGFSFPEVNFCIIINYCELEVAAVLEVKEVSTDNMKI